MWRRVGPEGIFGGRPILYRGKAQSKLNSSLYQMSLKEPVTLDVRNKGKTTRYALYKDSWYSVSDHDLSESDILALIKDSEQRRQNKLEAVRTPASNKKKTRELVSSEVQRAVWRRDQGKCVKCRSGDAIHYDHIIPVSKGGSNSVNNIQILCAKCNMKKGATIGG